MKNRWPRILATTLAAIAAAGWFALAAARDGPADESCLAPNSSLSTGTPDAQCREILAAGLRSEPYNVASLAMLASFTAASGDVAKARVLLAQADRTSRRHAETQYWLFIDALARNDVDEALRHADVLFRTQVELPLPVTLPLISSLDQSAVRGALATYISAAPRPWSGRLIQAIADSARSPDVAALLLVLKQASGDRIDISHAPLAERLMREEKYAAIKAYLSNVKGRSAELVRDPRFDRDGPGWLLGWNTPDQAAGAAQWQEQFGGRRGVFVLQHDLFSSGQPLMQQALFAVPGPSRLTVASQATSAASSGAFQVTVRCLSGPVVGRQILTGASGEWSETTATFVIPPNCPAQTLIVEAVLGDVRSDAEIGLDRLSVRQTGSSDPEATAD